MLYLVSLIFIFSEKNWGIKELIAFNFIAKFVCGFWLILSISTFFSKEKSKENTLIRISMNLFNLGICINWSGAVFYWGF